MREGNSASAARCLFGAILPCDLGKEGSEKGEPGGTNHHSISWQGGEGYSFVNVPADPELLLLPIKIYL
jgi:hypothetical protein